jgi:type VII secretion integral membrane protein EccD
VAVNVVTNLCRLTIVAERNRVDLAVPVDMAVADLLATVVGGLGRQVADDGAAGSGWVLQQVGRAPLDPGRTLAMEQVIDGAVLRLMPKSQQLPELAYDDVFETVGIGISDRTSRWNAEATRHAATVIAAIALLWGWGATLLSGPKWLAPMILLAVTTALLILACGALSRAVGNASAALLAGAFAVLYAAGTGAAAVGANHELRDFGAVQLLPAAGAAVLTAAICLALAGNGISLFVTIICTGLLGAIGAGAANLLHLDTDVNSAQLAASLIAVVTLVLSPLAPMLAFRLSRLELPNMPADATELRRDESRVDGPLVLDQAIRADQHLTGLSGGIGLSLAIAAVVLAAGGTSANILAVVIGVICLLRARVMTGRVQRSALLGSGVAAILAVLTARAIASEGLTRTITYLAPAVAAGLALIALALSLPGRRLSPIWGRLADIGESVLVLAVIPLALSVMGVYGLIRSSA